MVWSDLLKWRPTFVGPLLLAEGGGGLVPVLAMKYVIQMALKSIHDGLFRLTYILDPAFFASKEIDEIVEPAGISLRDNVGGTSGSTDGPLTEVQFRTISAVFVFADFGGIDSWAWGNPICE